MHSALFAWLPDHGILGAALASIASYSTMFVVALFWLLRRGQIGLWECLRPRREDIPLTFKPAALREQLRRLRRRKAEVDGTTGDAFVAGIE